MPDTFDPLPLASGPACVQALRGEYDIRVSQRLGARLVALAKRRVQLSLALIETAAPGSDLERVLLDDAWNGCETTDDVRRAIGPWGRVAARGATIQVVAPDEADDATIQGVAPDETDDVPAVAAPSTRSGVLAPAAASNHPVMRPPPRGDAPLDPQQLTQAAETLFDAEDPAELMETLRRLFRATLAAGMAPTPLLTLALQRAKRPLSSEVGALTRQHLDRETGRAIEDLQSDDEGRMRDAIHVLMRLPGESPLAPLVLPAITAVLADPRALRHVLALLADALSLVADDLDTVEPFVEALLDQILALEAPERFTLSRFLLQAHERVRTGWLPALLYRRLRATVDPQVQAFYGNVLARMPLDDALREQLTTSLVDLYVRHGHDVALSERLKATFLFLGPLPLERLTRAARDMENPMLRGYVVDLWIAYLSGGHAHPPLDVLAAFLASELASRNRMALLAMIRSSQTSGGRVDLMTLPALFDHVRDHAWVLTPVVGVLLEEAVHLEEPDDRAVLDFLARLGRPAVEAAYERAREEAALDSRAAPYRFRVFACTAAQQPQQPWLTEMADTALGWPFLRRLDLPVTLEGLGLLGRIPGLSESALGDILDRLLPEDGEACQRFADARVRAVLDLYESPTCPTSVRESVESRLERIVASDAPPRDVLMAALGGLEMLVERPTPPLQVERITVTLARKVLQKSHETSLRHLLADALRDETEGEGVRIPHAWSKEERDHALVILGKTAAHPLVAEPLHRMISARLAGFTEDWLDAHERGENLYQHRDTPLWRIMFELVERRPSEHAVEAAVRVGLRALEVHRHAPAHLALERREDVQRLVGSLVWLAPQEAVEVRGSLTLDIPRTALTTLMTLATRDNENARLILGEIAPRVPERLRPQLEGFLSFQRRGGPTP